MKIILNIIILVLIFLTSCGIEKRIYRPGYHLYSKHNIHIDKINSSSKKPIKSFGIKDKIIIDSAYVTDTENENNIVTENTLITSSQNNKDLFLGKHEMLKNSNIKIKVVFQEKTKENVITASEKNKNMLETNNWAILAFIFSLLGILSVLSAAIISSSFIILLPLFTISGIIFGLKGLKEIKKDSTKWKGKGLSIAGIVIGIIILALLLLVLVLYVLAFG